MYEGRKADSAAPIGSGDQKTGQRRNRKLEGGDVELLVVVRNGASDQETIGTIRTPTLSIS